MKLETFASAAFAATILAGCGDSLFTAQDRGDAILSVTGKALSSAADDKPATDYEVGVLFMRHVWDWNFDGEYALDLEFVKGTLTGDFPAAFQVQLDPPAETYPHNGISLYETWNGELGLSPFLGEPWAPEQIRIGHLVIGPKAELAALPRRIAVSRATPPHRVTFGAALAQHLPNTTVTSYQVLYSQGVSPNTRMYSFTRIGGGSGGGGGGGSGRPDEGIEVKEGYMLLDTTTFTRAVQWSECAFGKRDQALASSRYQTCMSDNAPLRTCYDNCIRDHADPDSRIACYSVCDQTYPDMVQEHVCLERAIRPLAEAACGEEALPDVTKLKVLNPTDPLSVRLGEDDVKTGLWVLHSTIFNR